MRLDRGILTYKYAGWPEEVFQIFVDHGMYEAPVSESVKFLTGGSADTPPHIRALVSHRPVWGDPLQQGCLNMVRTWISNCHRNHHKCSQLSERHTPKRLVNVRQSDLFLEINPPPGIPYVILSYCWGSAAVFSTTSANLARYQECIDFDGNIKTFADAIEFTRRLKIDYIWIDALCIIQDQANDWEVECQKMGQYYSNAYLTISVLDAASSHEGFLSPRTTLDSVDLFRSPPVKLRHRLPMRRQIFENAILNKRGWTFQERLLSTRIVHFSRTEMFWECQTCSTRESDASEHWDSIDTSSLVHSEGDDFKRILLHIRRYLDADNQEKAYRIWYHLVKQFSRRTLTKFSDRLPAVSAIARHFAKALSARYIAGSWAEDLHGLLWARLQRRNQTYHGYWEEDNFRAPSWSWAAVGGEIAFPFTDEIRTHSAQDATFCKHTLPLVFSPGIDPYGEYRSGSITIKALSKRVQCLPTRSHSRRFNTKPWKAYLGNSNMQRKTEDYYNGHIPYNLSILDEVGDLFGDGITDDVTMDVMVTTCEAIWIAEYIYNGRKSNKAVYFLLLVPDDRDARRWRRVGMGVTRDKPLYQGFYTSVYDNYCWKEFELV